MKAAMLTDAHCHPWDLLASFPPGEEERQRLGALCAASAWRREEFAYHETLAAGPLPPVLCFGVHPQLPAHEGREHRTGPGSREGRPFSSGEALAFLQTLAAEGRIDAVGEAGFDLYDRPYRETEARQDELFAAQLEIALDRGLPLVLHIRRAMHKVFSYSRSLKRLPAVVFHSYSGTLREGLDLLKRGINAFFSFGAPILLNHKTAMDACARLPPERLLLETDAPYQGLRGRPFSSWGDLPAILRAATDLRREAGSPGGSPEDLEAIIAANFHRAYGREG
jgi:TatD DNase family protein